MENDKHDVFEEFNQTAVDELIAVLEPVVKALNQIWDRLSEVIKPTVKGFVTWINSLPFKINTYVTYRRKQKQNAHNKRHSVTVKRRNI